MEYVLACNLSFFRFWLVFRMTMTLEYSFPFTGGVRTEVQQPWVVFLCFRLTFIVLNVQMEFHVFFCHKGTDELKVI